MLHNKFDSEAFFDILSIHSSSKAIVVDRLIYWAVFCLHCIYFADNIYLVDNIFGVALIFVAYLNLFRFFI